MILMFNNFLLSALVFYGIVLVSLTCTVSRESSIVNINQYQHQDKTIKPSNEF